MSNEVEPKVTDTAEVLDPEEQTGEPVAEDSPEEAPAADHDEAEEAPTADRQDPTADAETEPEASTEAPSDEATTPEATDEDVATETEDQDETPEAVPAEVTAEAEEIPVGEGEEQTGDDEVQSDAAAAADVAVDASAEADDIDESDETAEEPAETTKALSLDEIEPGKEYEGVVRNIQAYGAFVDIGAESDGLVHISELRDGYVEKVEDIVSVNEKITVRVKDVDAERGRISLTMREPGKPKQKKTSLRQIREGEEYTGVVTSIVDFGAFIDIGATTDGLVHISELSDDRVNRVEDVVSEGDEVTVRVLNVDKRRKRISLSMRPPEETDFTYDDEDEEETPTLIELAFARAAEEAEEDEKQTTRQKKPSTNSSGLSDIIRRTIDDHESKA